MALIENPAADSETPETAHDNSQTFTYMIRNKFICMEHETIEEFRDTYKFYMQMMDSWIADGIKLLDDGGVGDDYSTFYTKDPVVAERYGFQVEQNDEEDYEDEYYEEFGTEEDNEEQKEKDNEEVSVG